MKTKTAISSQRSVVSNDKRLTTKRGGRITVRNRKGARDFSRRFKVMIAELNISQKKLAKMLGGLSVQTISRLSTNVSQTIPIGLVVSLARFADINEISVNWLFTGKGNMRENRSATEVVEEAELNKTKPSLSNYGDLCGKCRLPLPY